MADKAGNNAKQPDAGSRGPDEPKRRRRNEKPAEAAVGQDDGGRPADSGSTATTAQAESPANAQAAVVGQGSRGAGEQGGASVKPIKPRKPRSDIGKSHTDAAKAKSKADAVALAEQLTMLANTLAMTALGPAAEMNDTERTLVSIGLPPVLENLSPEQATKFVTLANPLILLAGVAAWGLRLAQLTEGKVKAAREARPAKVAKPVEPSNGTANLAGVVLPTVESTNESGFGSPDARTGFMGDGSEQYF